MKVELIDYTKDAVEKLIYTKNTRLTQGEETRRKIEDMSEEEKMKELAYMAGTIPSSWEFVSYTFEITGVSRAFTHQFVRTRTGSFAHQSMRVQEMDNFGYMTPASITNDSKLSSIYHQAMQDIQDAYNELVEAGAMLEDARGILPTNIHSNIIAQFNLRTLSEMARSRTSGRVQQEYRDVINLMFREVRRVHPWAGDFLFPTTIKDLIDLEKMIASASETFTPLEITEARKKIDRIKKVV